MNLSALRQLVGLFIGPLASLLSMVFGKLPPSPFKPDAVKLIRLTFAVIAVLASFFLGWAEGSTGGLDIATLLKAVFDAVMLYLGAANPQ